MTLTEHLPTEAKILFTGLLLILAISGTGVLGGYANSKKADDVARWSCNIITILLVAVPAIVFIWRQL